MAIYQQLQNQDEVFKNLKEKPIIINDLPNITVDDREYIERLITTRYTSDMVSNLARCKCGFTKGEFTKHTVCEYCHTPVISSFENTVEPLVWFAKPPGVRKLMTPVMWSMINTRLTKSRYSILRWLTDTSYSPLIAKPPVLSKIINANIQRGYNYFVDNFLPIMTFLLSLPEFRVPPRETDTLMELIERDHLIMFSDHIPVINRSLLVVENTPVGVYVDSSVPMAKDAIEMMISIDRDFHDQSQTAKENRVARAMFEYASFHEKYIKSVVSGKPGMIRRNLGGSRFDYTGRAVIASRTGPHRYDEIVISWGMAVTMFRPMLVGKLMGKSMMTLNDAVGLILGSVHKYDPLIDRYLKEILAEAPDGRYPMLINRFPSLLQGSIQLVYAKEINPDPAVKVIQISPLVIVAPNADFDGDAMSVLLSLDLDMAKAWAPLHPKFNIYGMAAPLEISKNLSIVKPVVALTGFWLDAEK